MTAPNTPPASTGIAGTTQTHTWIYVGLNALAGGLGLFAPKVQAYAGAHPTATLIVTGLAGVLGSFLPSPTQPKAP